MATPTPKAFAELLHSAVNEPGIISQAYRQFHSYSVGNQLLAWLQCLERSIQAGPINTYPGVISESACMPSDVWPSSTWASS